MASEKKKKITNEDTSRNRKIIAGIFIFISALLLLVLISGVFGTFNNIKVRKNKNNIFSVSDLTLGNLKFSDTEDTIVKELGKPNKTEDKKDDIYSYKVYYYNGLTLTLKENYKDYILVKAEITSSRYKTSRGIKVGNKILKVMKKYRVDNTKGTYLYGNYTVDALSNNEIKDNVYFGVRGTEEVVYINKDASVDGKPSNIARLNIGYSHGRVNKITWSYDVK